MAKNVRTVIIVLLVIAVAVLINHYLQNRYTTSSQAIFTGDQAAIARFTISKGGTTITLEKVDDQWHIAGNDTLVVRQIRLDNLFNSVLTTKRETPVSRNPEKWEVYSVNDSLGIRLRLFDSQDKVVGDYYFGRSKADWSHNNFRSADEDVVYLTATNVLYHLNATNNFWGEKPKPPAPDTTAVAPDSLLGFNE